MEDVAKNRCDVLIFTKTDNETSGGVEYRAISAVLVVTMVVRCATYVVDCQKVPNCYAPGVFLELKMHQNSFLALAMPQTPLGELTMLPQTPIRLGRGYLFPVPLPLNTFGIRSRRQRAP